MIRMKLAKLYQKGILPANRYADDEELCDDTIFETSVASGTNR